MRIEHIAMYVNNLEKEKEFFELYFGAKTGKKYVHLYISHLPLAEKRMWIE